MMKRLTEPLAVYSLLITLAVAGLLVPGWRPVSGVVAVIIGLLLLGFFHELGHCLVAVAQGYRFLFLVVGPLRLEETQDGPRVLVNRSWEYAGGVCACLPERVPDEQFGRAHMLQYLAGPVTSLAIAAAVFAFGGSDIPLPAALLGAASLGMGVATLMPSHQGAMVSDGLGFRILRRGGHDADILLSRVRLSVAMYSEVRPAAWRAEDAIKLAEELVRRPLAPSDREWPGQIVDRSVLYYHFVDRGEIDKAGALLDAVDGDAAAARSQSATVQSLILLSAFHLAWYMKDAAGARQRLGLVQRVNPLLESDWQRALAAVMIVEGDCDAARVAIDRAKSGFPRQLARTSAGAMEWKWLAALTAALEQSH